MLHHVSLEVTPDDADRSVDFWRILGFGEVKAPKVVADQSRWLAREGTQVHLLISTRPVVPPEGHTAVVVDDFDQCLEQLEAAGFTLRRSRELWGAPRAKALAPGGHVVELMAGPPP